MVSPSFFLGSSEPHSFVQKGLLTNHNFTWQLSVSVKENPTGYLLLSPNQQ